MLDVDIRGDRLVAAVVAEKYLIMVCRQDWDEHHWDAALAECGVNAADYHYVGEDAEQDIQILVFAKQGGGG